MAQALRGGSTAATGGGSGGGGGAAEAAVLPALDFASPEEAVRALSGGFPKDGSSAPCLPVPARRLMARRLWPPPAHSGLQHAALRRRPLHRAHSRRPWGGHRAEGVGPRRAVRGGCVHAPCGAAGQSGARRRGTSCPGACGIVHAGDCDKARPTGMSLQRRKATLVYVASCLAARRQGTGEPVVLPPLPQAVNTFRRILAAVVPHQVSTCGAGDSLVAGAAAALLQGEAVEAAVAFGMAVALRVVQSRENAPRGGWDREALRAQARAIAATARRL